MPLYMPRLAVVCFNALPLLPLLPAGAACGQRPSPGDLGTFSTPIDSLKHWDPSYEVLVETWTSLVASRMASIPLPHEIDSQTVPTRHFGSSYRVDSWPFSIVHNAVG